MPVPTLKRVYLFNREDLPIAVIRQTPQVAVMPHAHDFSELVIIMEGQGMHLTGNEKYEIAAGDVFVISGPREHGYSDTEDLILTNILFDAHTLQLPKYDIRSLPGYHALFTIQPRYRTQHQFKSRLRISLTELEHTSGLVDALESEIASDSPGCTFAAVSILMQLIAFLSRCYSRSKSLRTRPVFRIASAVSHIEHHYEEPITLDVLSRIAGMSKSSLLRAFRQSFGTTPIDYLLNVRVMKACGLLRHTDLNITEIAYRTGFSDSNYFARQFRKFHNTSPSAYRKAMGSHL